MRKGQQTLPTLHRVIYSEDCTSFTFDQRCSKSLLVITKKVLKRSSLGQYVSFYVGKPGIYLLEYMAAFLINLLPSLQMFWLFSWQQALETQLFYGALLGRFNKPHLFSRLQKADNPAYVDENVYWVGPDPIGLNPLIFKDSRRHFWFVFCFVFLRINDLCLYWMVFFLLSAKAPYS